MSGKITSLEVQQRNKERVNVYLDGEFAFGLNLMDAAHLYKGQVLSDSEIKTLEAKDEVARALDSAVRFLAPRPRSTAEVRRRLTEKGVTESAIDEVIDRLTALDYLNDLEFARFWVRNRNEFNPRGERALRYELRQKGIETAIIQEVLSEVDAPVLALQAAQKKARSLRNQDAPTIRQKLGDYLARRGFDYDVIQTVVKQIIEEFGADDEDYF